jgi:tRNA (guanine37-N1)-methyltransferase
MRIAQQVAGGETVVNMFAGVGCFSLIMVKHSNPLRVYSIDVNPAAAQFMRENTRLNEAYGVVVPILGDAKKIVEQRLHGIADRVLMPLPEKAFEYLPYALLALKRTRGLVHYYDFEHAKKDESPVEKVKAKVTKRLESLGVAFDFSFGRVARSTGPNWYHVVLDISITH